MIKVPLPQGWAHWVLCPTTYNPVFSKTFCVTYLRNEGYSDDFIAKLQVLAPLMSGTSEKLQAFLVFPDECAEEAVEFKLKYL